MENAKKSIYPHIWSDKNNDRQISEIFTDAENPGLTKREHFAGLAMQGLIASTNWEYSRVNEDYINKTAEYSLVLADKLLKQLEN